MAEQKVRVIRVPKIKEFQDEERFAVVRKQFEKRRYYCNFKKLFPTKEEAEASALKLSKEFSATFYVIEVQSVART